MKPMLGAKEPKEMRFPCFASAKIDGIRAVLQHSIVMSRKLIPIPNRHVQDLFGCVALEGLDGELAVGPPNTPDLMQKTMSGVMSEDGEPDVTFWVFDYWTDTTSDYRSRYQSLRNGMDPAFVARHPRVQLLPQRTINTAEELAEFEEQEVNAGFEGIMTRCPEGVYKYGRSTPREQFLVKHKRFKDDEAVVIGFEERMHNANEATVDDLGHTKRSSHKENLVPCDTLGAFLVRNKEGLEFKVSPGVLTHQQRAEVWGGRNHYLGKTIVYKHFAVTGVKDKPRFNIFKSFRDTRDMGDPV